MPSAPPIVLGTGPADATTHWYQTAINFGAGYSVTADGHAAEAKPMFSCMVELAVVPEAPRRYALTVELA
jgi:hypothetical protein